ncbi:hypothetical protein LCGC14_2856610 [marine sediment metagenome]|uniref:Uncharacterized protein n=1 Tax=marine sediment metagenome TaxID=412755 RepID=A0A0F8Y724_9ZZZZ
MRDADIEDLEPFGFHKDPCADISKQIKCHSEELESALSGKGKEIVKIPAELRPVVEKL